MKATKQIIGKLTVGCVLALGLTLNIHAQDQKSRPGTYYSAKDPDLVPLPFNPHLELEVVEIEPGIFWVDDTGLPDTREQLASRMHRQEAAERAKAIAVNPALAEATGVAQQAAQAAAWKANKEKIAPWLHQDLRDADGSASTLVGRRTIELAQLKALAQVLAVKAEKDHAMVAEYLAAHNLPSAVSVLPDGRLAVIVAIENGIPRVQTGCNLEAADTVGTDELWPGGNTGLNLTGTNVVLGMWDAGKVREHAELGFDDIPRLTYMDSPPYYSYHSTHVAGTLIASGSCADCCGPADSPFAKGMSFQGRVLAWDLDNDAVEMTGATITNALRLSNHSYGFQAGWGIITNTIGVIE